jgi:hypothetical protein
VGAGGSFLIPLFATEEAAGLATVAEQLQGGIVNAGEFDLANDILVQGVDEGFNDLPKEVIDGLLIPEVEAAPGELLGEYRAFDLGEAIERPRRGPIVMDIDPDQEMAWLQFMRRGGMAEEAEAAVNVDEVVADNLDDGIVQMDDGGDPNLVPANPANPMDNLQIGLPDNNVEGVADVGVPNIEPRWLLQERFEDGVAMAKRVVAQSGRENITMMSARKRVNTTKLGQAYLAGMAQRKAPLAAALEYSTGHEVVRRDAKNGSYYLRKIKHEGHALLAPRGNGWPPPPPLEPARVRPGGDCEYEGPNLQGNCISNYKCEAIPTIGQTYFECQVINQADIGDNIPCWDECKNAAPDWLGGYCEFCGGTPCCRSGFGNTENNAEYDSIAECKGLPNVHSPYMHVCALPVAR